MSEFKEQYDSLTDYEKHIINSTALSIDDINYYEDMISRKMTKQELKVVSLLCNHGVKLDRYFLSRYISHE